MWGEGRPGWPEPPRPLRSFKTENRVNRTRCSSVTNDTSIDRGLARTELADTNTARSSGFTREGTLLPWYLPQVMLNRALQLRFSVCPVCLDFRYFSPNVLHGSDVSTKI